MSDFIEVILRIPREQANRLADEIDKALADLREDNHGTPEISDAELIPVSPVPLPLPADPIKQPNESINMAAPTGRPLPWGKQASDSYGMEFIEGLLWIESQIGLKPELLLPCMKFESNISHTARNPLSSASGLIQFMSFTAINLGTTIEKIRTMDVMTQLSFVYKYFKDFDDRGFEMEKWDIADTYMAILWPAGIGKPLDHSIFVRGAGRTYDPNRGLDANKDGRVTKREAANKIIRLEAQGYLAANVLVI